MNTKYVQTKGTFLDANSASISASFEDMLEKIGERGVEIMRRNTVKYDFKSDLTNSIMWRTALAAGGKLNNDPDIASPGALNIVDIGSANDHAYFRENGTSRHTTNIDHDKFISKMKEWCRLKLGFDPDVPQNKRRFYSIIKKIRDYGTTAAPFAITSVEEIRMEARNVCLEGITQYWKKGKWGNV